MRFIDNIKKRRADKLLERGHALLQEVKLDEALEIADRLRELRHSGAFEIGALARAAKGDLQEAVRVLEEGLEKAPDVWLNWQLLGNYLSDLERFPPAVAAYERALACPDVWVASVRLNQAILAQRRGDFEAALGLIEQVGDPELSLQAASVRMGALAGSGRAEEAERFGMEVLESAPDADSDTDALARIVAAIARIRMDRDGSTEPTRSFLVDHWQQWVSPEILAAIRDLDNVYSDRAEYYRLLVKGKFSETVSPGLDVRGFFRTCDVVADSPAEALQFVQRLDRHEPIADLAIEESRVLEPRPRDPKGVYWCSGRIYYDQD
jgi:tetratricopeptide (TPR) repeat protein